MWIQTNQIEELHKSLKESNIHQEQDGFSKTAFGILNLLFGKLRKVERDNRQVKEDSFGWTQRRYKKVKGKKTKKKKKYLGVPYF